ncbi:MAG: HAD family hydrolase [Akkermansiaceae bacterium]|jgi:phosphoglycolate phosphatase
MRALIFDLDGTLVESLPGIAASLNRALIQHGLPGQSHANVRGFIGDGAIKLVQRALATVSRIDITESVLKNFAADYAVSWPRGTSVYLGMLGLLQQLEEQAIPLAVLSNKPHPFTAEIVGKLFPNTHFTVVLGNQDDLPHKPDPTGALQIAHTLGVAPEDCIIIGDSIMDLETAKNANMKSIAVTWGYHDRERLVMADVIVDTMDQLDLAIQSLIS